MKYIALIVAAAVGAAAQAGTFAYVSNAEDGTISSYRIDRAQGRLQPLATTVAGPLVMPLAQSPDGRHLYASLYAAPYAVLSYRIDAQTGALDRVAAAGLPRNMPYIATDRSGRYLLAASYDGDQISVSPIAPGGVVQGEPLELHRTWRHAHAIVLDPSNRFAYVALLGADRVLQLAFDERSGALTPIGRGFVHAEKGAGPRHIAPAPNGRFLYVLNELSGSISTYAIDRGSGALRLLGAVESAAAQRYRLQKGVIRAGGPLDETPRIWAADIKISPDGRFVYATERTSSTVSGYRVDPAAGRLAYLFTLEVEKQPRGIAIDPRGRWLVVSGEKSAEVGLYAIDAESGALRRSAAAPAGRGANWVEIVDTD